MARELTTDTVGGVKETFAIDEASGTVAVSHHQDAQDAIDHVAAVNLAGAREVPGLGVLQAEVPTVVAMKFCQDRGIPWEAFLYGNEYDAEWVRFLSEHPKLCYRPHRQQFPIGNA